MEIKTEEIIEIVREAAGILKDRKAASHIQEKGIADYVTEVDLKVQEFIQKKLSLIYPEIQFMGEEKSNEEIDFDGEFWVLDPVDGTTNLIHDYRQSALSLALFEKSEVVLGVVYQPFTEELFFARKGKGAYLNERTIHVSEVETMSESLVSIGTSPYYAELAEDNFEVFLNVFKECQDIRRSGSAAIDLAYVACGRIDAYFEKRLKLWDFAAGMLLVEEAGGKITNYSGDKINVNLWSDIVVSNGKIHSQLLENFY